MALSYYDELKANMEKLNTILKDGGLEIKRKEDDKEAQTSKPRQEDKDSQQHTT
jgi:hypothetical protein